MQQEPFSARSSPPFDAFVVAAGVAACLVGAELPALTWTGAGEVSVIEAGGGRDPLANGDILQVVKWLAMLGCLVALGARLSGRLGIALLAGSVALIAAVAWAAFVPVNVVSVHEELFLTIDYGAVTVHPWIWTPAIGQFAVLLGLWLWAIGERRAALLGR